MAIACAYCKGQHDTAADVKQCWIDGGRQDLPVGGDEGTDLPPDDVGAAVAASPPRQSRRPSAPASRPARSRPQRPATTVAAVARGVASAGAGPDQLGRHCVVDPGAVVPAPWDRSDRVLIRESTLDDPADALAALRGAHHERRRLVIELDVDFDREPMLMTDAEPFQLGAAFTFDREALHHAVWSNSVDLRAEQPTWLALDQAIAGGATAVGDGPGDIVTPDGVAVWIDGGPVRHTDPIDGVAVVTAVSIEHGSFTPPGPNRCDADLAADQLAAVTHVGGAARIIAPAGSGKTRVLTERARHLLDTWNLPASAVSLVAFNKRAQEEMRERTPDLPDLQVRTLNAIALAITNGTAPFAPQPVRWSTIDEVEVRRIIGDLVSFPRRRNSDPVAPWIEALSLIRLGLLAPEDAEQRYDGDVDGLAEVWPQYRAALERRRAVDFDDQIYRALMVLLSDPVARRTAQRACRVMLVDEFQDLTPAHLLLIRLLAAPGGAVFGVGDDDQTIYGYNGADPAWLIDFGGLFPGAGAHPLEVNYRCPAGVVDIADRLLRHNDRRVAKTIRPASTATNGGWRVDPAVDPVGASVDAVSAALRDGAVASDVAVLTRVNALLAPVQVALSVAGIPVSGGVGVEFADRTAVRSVLSWLRLATRPQFGADDLREALRRPSRSFHPRINDWVCEQQNLVELHRLAGRLNNERDQDRLTDFAADIQSLRHLVRDGAPTSDLVLKLVDEIGLAGAVGTLDTHRHGMNRAAQGDDLTAVQHLAALHDDAATFEAWLREHLAARRAPGGVTLATVHRVKGQEWPHVVVHLADAHQYPHRLSDDIEEERRLFHVAITRASGHVTITTGPHPSPFVAELTDEPAPRAQRPVITSGGQREQRRAAPSASGRSSTPARSKSDPTADLDDAARQRFAALKDLRNELRDGKPAYVVFDNKTLVSIARLAPTTSRELAKIAGVGPAKLDKYGDAVTSLMQSLT